MKLKQLNPDFINKQQSLIDKKIDLVDDDPTYDGIVNPEIYCKTPIKILWILKEVNDDGGYNQREALDRGVEMMENRNDWMRTLDPIIYVSYSILNGFKTWSGMDDIRDDPQMVNVLKNIAYINVKKIPGGSQSDNSVIGTSYQKYKSIIQEQIDLAQPDIIICGNTLNHIMEDLGLSDDQLTSEDFIEYVFKDDCLIINAYHPNQKTITREDYCDSIINLAKKYFLK